MRAWMRAAVAALAWGSAAACSSESTAPSGGPVSTAELEFVRQAPTAPPLEAYRVSFWAVAGTTRKAEIRYATGEDFLEFEVGSKSLWRRPDGTAFLPGDSILITIAVDSVRFLAKFEPEGLRFSPEEPAELEIEYAKADSAFLVREPELRMWRQERAGEPWWAVDPLRFDEDLDEIEVEVLGFTRYALAIH